tara:strand:+ start:46 stop:231 length:186 start_codon:yes stop_codon:yes gene_type:complete
MDSKNYMKIIDEIENIRKNNNKNWMNILRLAFQHSPKEASKLMSEIYKDDAKISKLVKKLT